MQKKFCSTRALLLLTLLMVSMFVAGCGKKSYASVEEYLNANPAILTAMNTSMSSSDATGKAEVSGNTIIMKLYYKQTVWGLDSSIDSQLKNMMDQYFSQSESDLAESLADVSKESGVDVSQISYRFEYYNPDASTPSYTYTYPKK